VNISYRIILQVKTFPKRPLPTSGSLVNAGMNFLTKRVYFKKSYIMELVSNFYISNFIKIYNEMSVCVGGDR
jgi:hypothetical protein